MVFSTEIFDFGLGALLGFSMAYCFYISKNWPILGNNKKGARMKIASSRRHLYQNKIQKTKNDTILGFSPSIFLLIVSLNLFVGGLSTQYVVEFWGTHLRGVPVEVAFMPCAVVGLFFGEFTIPVAILTWLLSSAF